MARYECRKWWSSRAVMSCCIRTCATPTLAIRIGSDDNSFNVCHSGCGVSVFHHDGSCPMRDAEVTCDEQNSGRFAVIWTATSIRVTSIISAAIFVTKPPATDVISMADDLQNLECLSSEAHGCPASVKLHLRMPGFFLRNREHSQHLTRVGLFARSKCLPTFGAPAACAAH